MTSRDGTSLTNMSSPQQLPNYPVLTTPVYRVSVLPIYELQSLLSLSCKPDTAQQDERKDELHQRQGITKYKHDFPIHSIHSPNLKFRVPRLYHRDRQSMQPRLCAISSLEFLRISRRIDAAQLLGPFDQASASCTSCNFPFVPILAHSHQRIQPKPTLNQMID